MVVGLVAGLTAGCTTGGDGGGGPIGATRGTVIRSQVATGAGERPLGAVEGGLLGEDLGRSLDEADRALAMQAEFEALEYSRSGQPTVWRNPQTGLRGQIVVGSSYEVNRLDCREYTHTVYFGGRPRVARGTACREPGGNWRTIG